MNGNCQLCFSVLLQTVHAGYQVHAVQSEELRKTRLVDVVISRVNGNCQLCLSVFL